MLISLTNRESLTNGEKEKIQRRGYMSEHLLCLYSMTSDRTALYDGNFPVYFSDYGVADVILFGLADRRDDGLACVKELLKLPIKELNTVSPRALTGFAGIETRYVDQDYHISIEKFNIDLSGNGYRDIRYNVHRAEKMGYSVRLGREFTRDHTYVLSRHMSHHNLDVWDFEELLSLERFFREHDHGFMMEAYYQGKLVGFDVVDFFEDNRIMVVPLGIYLEMPSLADFLMYEDIKYAKSRGYEWLDIGLACRSLGLKSFKEKWLAEPKYQLFVQTIKNSR